jgi:hypothetical protein
MMKVLQMNDELDVNDIRKDVLNKRLLLLRDISEKIIKLLVINELSQIERHGILENVKFYLEEVREANKPELLAKAIK